MQVSALINVLPPFERKRDIIVSGDQSVDDIMIEVLNAHDRYAAHYDNLINFFSGNVPLQLFNFCKYRLPYREEPDSDQKTKSPAAILQSGKLKNDCKHFAGFIGGVLDAMNRNGLGPYNWKYRFVNYEKGNDKADHVFIVLDEDIWIDPTPIKEKRTGKYVTRQFNDRLMIPVNYRDLKSKKMLSSIHGLHYYVQGEDDQYNTGMCSVNGVGLLPNLSTVLGTAVPGVGPAIATANTLAQQLPDGGLKDWVSTFMSDPAGSIVQIFTGKMYTSGDYRLGEVYMRNILGMMEIQRRSQVPDGYVPQAWSFFTLALGVPIGSLDHIDQLVIGAANYKSWNNNSFSWVPDDQAQRANRILNQYIGWTPGYYPRDIAWELSKFAAIPYIYPIYDVWDGSSPVRGYTGKHPITGQQFSNGYPTVTASQPQSPTQPDVTQPGVTQPGSQTPVQTPGGTLYPQPQPAAAGGSLLPIVLIGGVLFLLSKK